MIQTYSIAVMALPVNFSLLWSMFFIIASAKSVLLTKVPYESFVLNELNAFHARCITIIESAKSGNRFLNDIEENRESPAVVRLSFDDVLEDSVLEWSCRECYIFVINPSSERQLLNFYDKYERILPRREAFYILALLETVKPWNSILSFAPEAIHLAAVFPIANSAMLGVYTRLQCGKDMTVGQPDLILTENGSVFSASQKTDYGLFTENLDFTCYDIRVTTFEYKPFVYIHTNEDGEEEYSGIEMNVFNAIARKIGFHYSLRPPTDGDLWGREIAPQNYSGLSNYEYIRELHTYKGNTSIYRSDGLNVSKGLNGDLQHRRTDMGFANCFVQPGFREFTDYAIYDLEIFGFLLKKPKPLPLWMSAVKAFDPITWLLLCIVVICVAICIAVYVRYHWNPELKSSDVLYIIAGGLLDVSQPGSKFVFSTSVRVFFITFFTCLFILTSAYRSAFTSTLSIPIVRKPLETLHDLAYDATPVASFLDNFKRYVSQSTDPAIMKLAERYGAHYDFDSAFQNASEGRLIMGESRNYLEYNIRSRFTNEFGETDMMIMKESLYAFWIAFMLQRDSVLLNPVSRTVQKLREGGFIQNWIREEMEATSHLVRLKGNLVQNKPWSVSDLQAGFFLFSIFIGISITAFVGELVWGLKNRNRSRLAFHHQYIRQ